MRAALLVAAIALPALACAQNLARGCPKAIEVTHEHLVGTWHAEFEGLPPADLALEPHPQLQESVRGRVKRQNSETEAAGDVDEGEFTLEESANGVNISATWLGDVVEGSCGREIRGMWKAEGVAKEYAFVLKKK